MIINVRRSSNAVIALNLGWHYIRFVMFLVGCFQDILLSY